MQAPTPAHIIAGPGVTQSHEGSLAEQGSPMAISVADCLGINSEPSRSAVACHASISLAAIWSKQQTSNISYSSEMDWDQVSIFFAVACFAAIVFFMIYRKPRT